MLRHLTLKGPPGSYDLCPVCFWEDDPVQLRYPAFAGGANGYSLIDARRMFAATGVSEPTLVSNVRVALDSEPVDPGWRVIRAGQDDFESWAGDPGTPPRDSWPSDATTLYWWRPTYRRRRS